MGVAALRWVPGCAERDPGLHWVQHRVSLLLHCISDPDTVFKAKPAIFGSVSRGTCLSLAVCGAQSAQQHRSLFEEIHCCTVLPLLLAAVVGPRHDLVLCVTLQLAAQAGSK